MTSSTGSSRQNEPRFCGCVVLPLRDGSGSGSAGWAGLPTGVSSDTRQPYEKQMCAGRQRATGSRFSLIFAALPRRSRR